MDVIGHPIDGIFGLIKLLHTADLHLDSPLVSLAMRDSELQAQVRAATRESLKKIVDLALQHEVTAVLVSGDLFDQNERNAQTSVFLTLQLNRLKDAGIRVFYVKGNHDADNPITGETHFPDNVHLFSGHGGVEEIAENILIHGVSFPHRSVTESLLPKFRLPENGKVNIALMHTSLAGDDRRDNYAPCHLVELQEAGFDYWALGHIHKRQVYCQEPWIVMPGIPQGRDVGEAGPKSVTLIEIEDGQISIEELPTSVIEFDHININISDCEDWDSLCQAVREELTGHSDKLQSPFGIVRVSLEGPSRLSWDILRDHRELEELIKVMARDTGKLWIDKVVINVETPLQSSAQDATSELVEIMAGLPSEDQFSHHFVKDAERVLSNLSTQIRQDLMREEDDLKQLIQDLSEDGVKRVAAMMRSSSSS